MHCADALAEAERIPWAEATVVVLYMGVRGNLTLRPLLLRHLQTGVRLVTVQFHMGNWKPEQMVHVDSHELHHDQPTMPLQLYVVNEAARCVP